MGNKRLTAIIAATISLYSLSGCKDRPYVILEPAVKVWYNSGNPNYNPEDRARRAVYDAADYNSDGKLSLNEAKRFLQDCPEERNYCVK